MAGDAFISGRFHGTETKSANDLGVMAAGTRHQQRLDQVRWLARMMDDRFAVPGTNFRFGWDAVIGLVPGLGDALTSAISLLIVHHAYRTGAGPLTLARMLGNVGVDLVIGAVPLAGDVFDAAWKSNRKNLRLLERHLERGARRRQR